MWALRRCNQSIQRIKNEKGNFGENYVKKIQREGALSVFFWVFKEVRDVLMNNDIDMYAYTSWCKLELYDADFGWGRLV